MTIPVGYCTNVHAGADLAQTRANLERYALAVKQRVSPDAPMGVGLWLSARSARQLVQERRLRCRRGLFAVQPGSWIAVGCFG